MFNDEEIARIMGMKRAKIPLKTIASRFNCSIYAIRKATEKRKCFARIDGCKNTPRRHYPNDHQFNTLE